jgi:CBS domain containing-hemolysin-like protein
MEDVLEEIVGPIQDEYDEPEERDVVTLAPGEYLVVGTASLEDICELLRFDVEEEDTDGTDTIGGLFFGLLGHVPEVGDSVAYKAWRMVAERVDGRRVERLRLSRLPASPSDAEAGS